jgi:hypothetical protein
MKPLVLISSAVETRFGVYKPQERFDMTVETIRNLREHMPNAIIGLTEMSGNGLDVKYKDHFEELCDYFFDWTTDLDVQNIYNSPAWIENWDVVKNLTELVVFPTVFHTITENNILEDEGIDRVFKISGRYLLNDQFDLSAYERPEVRDKVVVGKRRPSQFPYEVTLLREQYMSRLFSWPTALHKDMTEWFATGRNYMMSRLRARGYADLEHCLFYCLPKEHVYEIEDVGVFGKLAPNGQTVQD